MSLFYRWAAWRRAPLTAARRPWTKLCITMNTTLKPCSSWPATCSASRKQRYDRTSAEQIAKILLRCLNGLMHSQKEENKPPACCQAIIAITYRFCFITLWAAGHYEDVISVSEES